jgi:hypothetical protein
MGFRFYRRIKLFPGVNLNLSRSGVSTSIGVRGAHVTVGHGKVRETGGLPGTGLSYMHVEGGHNTASDASGDARPAAVPDVLRKGRAWGGWLRIALVIGFASRFAWSW